MIDFGRNRFIRLASSHRPQPAAPTPPGSDHRSVPHTTSKGAVVTADRLTKSLLAAGCVAAPLTGLVAAVAAPALSTSAGTELTEIGRHSDRYYVYALFILLSSYLLVPAVFGIGALIRSRAPRWAVVSTAVAQAGLLVAIGDAAVEVMYWQMGRVPAGHEVMTSLSTRYDSAFGSSIIYSVGGVATMLGVALLAVGLWRTRATARWVSVVLVFATIGNFVGFSSGSQPILVASYLLLAAALMPIAIALLDDQRVPVSPVAPSPAATTVGSTLSY